MILMVVEHIVGGRQLSVKDDEIEGRPRHGPESGIPAADPGDIVTMPGQSRLYFPRERGIILNKEQAHGVNSRVWATASRTARRVHWDQKKLAAHGTERLVRDRQPHAQMASESASFSRLRRSASSSGVPACVGHGSIAGLFSSNVSTFCVHWARRSEARVIVSALTPAATLWGQFSQRSAVRDDFLVHATLCCAQFLGGIQFRHQFGHRRRLFLYVVDLGQKSLYLVEERIFETSGPSLDLRPASPWTKSSIGRSRE
jgi:hypothetical protein